MPYVLKPNKLFVKDPEGTGFLPQNAISDRTTAEDIALWREAVAEITENGQEAVDSFNAQAQEAISAAQAAADGIEAQKDTMIASIASVAGQGTDTTLTQSGVAADAKATGDEVSALKSAITRDNWITPEMINGNSKQPENVSTLLNGSAYSYRTSSGTLGFMTSSTSCAIEISIADLPNDIDYIYWDYDHTTNQSSQPIVLTTGVNAGDAVVGYFSQSEIVNASTSFNTYGGLYDAENHILRISIAEIRARKPNATFVVLAVANGVNAYIYADVTPKKLKWLKISGENAENLLIVDPDGNGDFTTIQSAIDNAHDNDTIFILDGEYKETVVVSKYLHIVGQSKQGVVLYQNIGDYNNCPLLITQGSVCNMTIKSIAPADTSGLADYAYAIHLDKNFSLTNGKCEIYNCDIYSEVNDAIGAGTNYAQIYDLHDNRIFVSADPVKAGACSFKCHIGAGQTGGKVTLKNNTIIAVGSNGTSFYDVLFHDGGITGVSNCEVELIGNVCKTFRNASSFFSLNNYCANNTVAAMNTIN